MSPQVLDGNNTLRAADPPDLIDRIANALPEELRADYYREMAHCRSLPESDEMLRVLRAMQFLGVLIDQAPTRLANEREQLAGVLAGAIVSLKQAHEAQVAHQKQLEARLSKLPDEVAKGISADAIAARVSEHLRQRIQETGLPGVAEAIHVEAAGLRKASKELSVALDEFSSPRQGAVPVLNRELASMKSNLGSAADHIRAQMNGLGKELWRSIALVSAGTLAVGFVGGILYHRWITSPVETPTDSTPQVQAVPSAGPPLKKSPQHRSPPSMKNP